MGAMLRCEAHDAPVVLECRTCRRPACPDCARHVWTPAGFVDECPRCDGVVLDEILGARARVARVEAQVEPGASVYLARLPELLRFPLRRAVLVQLGWLALLLTPLAWAAKSGVAGSGFYGFALVLGLEISAYFHIVRRTAHGDVDLDPPDFTSLSDLVGLVVDYLAALTPILAALLWYGSSIDQPLVGAMIAAIDPRVLFAAPGPAALLLVGLALLPLCTVIAAMGGGVLAILDPRRWLGSLRMLGSTYLAAAGCFYVVFGLEVFALRPLLVGLRALDLPMLPALVATFVGYLALALRARLLGALCEPFTGND